MILFNSCGIAGVSRFRQVINLSIISDHHRYIPHSEEAAESLFAPEPLVWLIFLGKLAKTFIGV